MVGLLSGATTAACLRNVGVVGDEQKKPAEIELPRLGKLKTRPAKEIAASPLSVGFETLDRSFFDPRKTYAHLAALGAKWARVQTGWSRTERVKGYYEFAWLDEVVDALRGIGMQPWFNLGYGNKLYSPQAPNEAAVGWAPIFDDAAREAWLAFVRQMAEHFGGRVRHWEIWNEPNITAFWQPRKPDAAGYLELLRATVPEIRKRMPEAVIIGGAFAGIPKDYIEQCLKLGMGELVDKISYHPYRPLPEQGYAKEIENLRELLARHKCRAPLWQGECGCPSQPGGSGALAELAWDETRQAKWLLRRILTDLALEIELTSYFHTVDMVGYFHAGMPKPKTNFKGLLKGSDYTPKRSYFAYQNLCALFDAETKRSEASTFTIEGRGNAPVQTEGKGFARRGRALYAYWQPADLFKEVATPKVRVVVKPENADQLAQPVLVELLTGAVYRLTPQSDGGQLAFDALPLADSPLILTDARAIALSGA